MFLFDSSFWAFKIFWRSFILFIRIWFWFFSFSIVLSFSKRRPWVFTNSSFSFWFLLFTSNIIFSFSFNKFFNSFISSIFFFNSLTSTFFSSFLLFKSFSSILGLDNVSTGLLLCFIFILLFVTLFRSIFSYRSSDFITTVE